LSCLEFLYIVNHNLARFLVNEKGFF